MNRTLVNALQILLVVSCPISSMAGQPPTGKSTTHDADHPRTGGAPIPTMPSARSNPPVTAEPPPSGVMELKRQVTGDLSYRFISTNDKSGTATIAPVTLPEAPGGDNIIPLRVPSSLNIKDGKLEVLDNNRGNIARLPITLSASSKPVVADLTESSFTLAQRVNVPIQARGLGVIGAQVAMTCASRGFSQTRLLQPDDNGIARFDAVPLNSPVTVTVSYGSNPPESQTKTLAIGRPADAWPPIVVTWPDVKTVTAPPAAVSPGAPSGREPRATGRTPAEDTYTPSQAAASNPLNSLASTVISLLFLVAIAYGVFWAYKTGRLKTALDHLGINTAQTAPDPGAMRDPFKKQDRSPIQPIIEGTADPFVGGAMAGATGPPLEDSPRLVASAGAYSGVIFRLNSATAEIGRDTGIAVALPNDSNASRRHATILTSNGQYSIVDNASSNGTFVNGVRVPSQTPQPLRPGDEVQIGMTRFRFEA